MHKRVAVAGIVSLLFASALAPGLAAATKATVYIVHGLPGKDIGKAADLPVNVTFNGVHKALDYRLFRVSPALKINPGAYAVKVYEAGTDGTTPLVLKTSLVEKKQGPSLHQVCVDF